MEIFANFSELIPLYQKVLNFEIFSGDDNTLLNGLPNNPGVYIIKRGNEVIYIGSSGKLNRDGEYSKSVIRNRLRYSSTPYKFEGLVLKYNPSTTGVPPEGYYNESLIKDLEITCIYFNQESDKLAPSALEHLLIQSFINEFGVLPEINQKI